LPSAVCLGCGARVDDGAPCACESIGEHPYRHAALDARPKLGACPRCHTSLIDTEYADTPLDECQSCGGVFIEAWILDRLVAAREARVSLSIALPIRTLHREAAVRYLRCPRCSTQMNRKIFGRSSGIVVDICKGDGIWFDHGELASALEFIEGGGLERAKEREDAERAEEARRERVRRTVESGTARKLTAVPRRTELAAQLFDTLLDWWRS
jgi:Zn-finger nucleic acid-binding protein